MRKFNHFLNALLAACSPIWGATCAATTQATVVNCLNTMSNGDVLQINGIGFTVSGTIQPPAALSNFTIIGEAAAYPARGAGAATTTLTNDGANPIFLIQQNAGGNIRISSMRFVYSGGFPGAIQMECCATSIRLDNLTLSPTATADRAFLWGYQTWITGNLLVLQPRAIYGLMDHITFTAAGTVNANSCLDGVGLYNGADLDWTNPDNFGTTNAWYVEDSIFDGRGCSAGVPVSAIIDGEHGARIVMRHSDIKDMQVEVHDASTLMSWGARLLETDSLNFTCSRPDCGFQAIQFRGGTGFHHNSVIPIGTNGYENANATEITRVDSSGFQDPWFTGGTSGKCTWNGSVYDCAQRKICSDLEPHCDGVGGISSGQICGASGEAIGRIGVGGGACTTTPNGGTCGPGRGPCGVCQANPSGAVGTQGTCGAGNTILDHMDGSSAAGGYSAINQVGRGLYSMASNPHNTLRPVYWWNNTTLSGAQLTVLKVNGNGGEDAFIRANRDVFLGIDNTNCRAGGTAASCTAGVGQGTLANRPGHCSNLNFPGSFPGPGYFATDDGPQGTLYVCTNTDVWTSWYRPLAYPHPLQGGGSSVAPGTITSVVAH